MAYHLRYNRGRAATPRKEGPVTGEYYSTPHEGVDPSFGSSLTSLPPSPVASPRRASAEVRPGLSYSRDVSPLSPSVDTGDRCQCFRGKHSVNIG